MDSVLTVSGLIANPGQYDLADLSRLEPGAQDEPGMVRLERIIEASRPDAEADHVTAVSADGSYSASIPLAEATRLGEVHVHHEEQGETSLRLLVPGGATLCWNVKSLGLLRVTAGPEPDSLPEVLTH
ncbi:MAG: hypothetical protein OXH33_00275 [bacterium]|nr:hypothetical protein [bacterium]